MGSDLTVSVSTIIDVYHTLLEQGIDQQLLINKSGISLEDIDNPDGRVSISKLNTLWDIAIAFTKNPAIGLIVGGKVDPSRFSVVTQASFQCETILQGLQKYVRFFSIVNQGVTMSLREEGDLGILEFQYASSEFYCVPEMERMISAAMARCHYLVGDKIKVKHFCFEHAQPEYIKEYETVFDAPLLFEQEKTAIVFDRSLLATKINKGNPYLLNVLTSYAEKLLQKIQSKSDVKDKVRFLIRNHLADDIELDVQMAAKELNMSRHTLYRKLKKEEVSFQSLVEGVRQEEALRHLQENRVSVSEVAFLLGFSELSAFSRAFKRWTGESPAQYRSSRLH